MRIIILLIILCATTISVNAQFKVQSDGKIAIQTTSTALSPISINCAGNSNYYLTCNTANGMSGLSFLTYGNGYSTSYGGSFLTQSANQGFGLAGEANSCNICIGVAGIAKMGTQTIGLYGSTYYTSRGAAVYGTTQGNMSISLPSSGIYAGYFDGNVKSTGSITAGTTVQGALLGESSNEARSLFRAESVTGSLSELNVTTFQKEKPVITEDTEQSNIMEEETVWTDEKPKPDAINEQFYVKTHYALDADRLEKVFPDLVYVRDDGSKMINYMEMIPLLVQSINELNAEIEELKGIGSARKDMTARSTTSIGDTVFSRNRLYQNTPNPFKETTTIRFSLADDAKDAAICIFDMTGKMLQKHPVSNNETSMNVNGYELGTGIYLYSLFVDGQEIDTKRMVLM